jgi:hypothetical protein
MKHTPPGPDVDPPDEEVTEYRTELAEQAPPKEPFGKVPKWVVTLGLTPNALCCYTVLATMWADRKGECWPSNQTIADTMGVSSPTAQRALKELEDFGCLTKTIRMERTEMGLRSIRRLVLRTRHPAITGLITRDEGGSSRVMSKPDPVNHSVDPSDQRASHSASLVPASSAWQVALAGQMQRVQGKRSWDLLDVYLAAWDDLQFGGGNINEVIGLCCNYIETVTGEPLDTRQRGMVAKTVRKHGKVALVGWDKALYTTESDTSVDRMRYAQGVITRILAEIEQDAAETGGPDAEAQ